ncbi:acylneuraminate cytidylyltransferase family protein [Halobacteriales archaeon QH_10_67_22]|nr:MAG: acylneuraminate cytidylyltransferase family protein [Halobacteriales archaeon QH_10_67_22]
MTVGYFGIIPARGGSKGVPRKNVRNLAGDPLIVHSIDAADGAQRLNEYIVSTDDEEIRQLSREAGAPAPALRPDELAADETPMEPVAEHALKEFVDVTPETLVLLQPTSPLRGSRHIDEAIERYEETSATSLVAVTEDHSNRWRRTEKGAVRLNYTDGTQRRQKKQPEYVETGAIYITDVASFRDTGDFRAGDTALYVMEDDAAVDINTEFDFWLAEQFLHWNER